MFRRSTVSAARSFVGPSQQQLRAYRPGLRGASAPATTGVCWSQQRWSSTAKLAVTIDKVAVNAADAGVLDVSLSNQKQFSFPVEWLVDNDVGTRHTTGQKVKGVVDTPVDWKNLPRIASAKLTQGTNDETVVAVELSDSTALQIRETHVIKYGARDSVSAQPTTAFLKEYPTVDVDVPHADYHQLLNDEKALGDAVLGITGAGLMIVDNCPPEMDSVTQIARRIGDLELTTIYGTVWSVQTAPTEGPKNNVAYTAEYLDYHHDLVYYHSPPGVQLLHCLKFEDSVQGGESLFLDGHIIAEELRRRDPEAFEALCTIPCAFMKDDMGRPVQLYYAAPHIHLNHEGVITELRWAPAFEAPLPVGDVATCRRYYRAKEAFVKVLTDIREKRQLKFRLKPGQTVVWLQTRVLHGREGFVEPEPHSRHLRGCYVGLEALWNKASVELYRREGKTSPQARGNRSFY